MTRVVYVNGVYQPFADACVHVEDRGFQFADGVYEVCEVRDGHLIDERRHIDRLERSLNELRMKAPMSRRALGLVMRETVRRNKVVNGAVYLQVTRGAAKRDFQFPAEETEPTLVCYGIRISRQKSEMRAASGIPVITVPDIRWKRVDIKTVALLPNALARQAALDAGAKEAWMVDDQGFITEGSSCNAWIVSQDGELITRSADAGILRGITRGVVMDLILNEGLNFKEKSFTVEEAKSAKEAFNTSATGLVMPVVAIDGAKIGDGKPGPVSQKIRRLFHDFAEKSSITALQG
jgi:D-alanine transaminase